MRAMRRSLFGDLKQIVWVLLLVYIVLAVMGYLFGKQIGHKDAFLVCLSIAVLVTVTFACIYVGMILWFLIEQKTKDWKRR
jgi:cation transporter-like permease